MMIKRLFFAAILGIVFQAGAAHAGDDFASFGNDASDDLFNVPAVSDMELDQARGMALLESDTLGIAILQGVSANNNTQGGTTGQNVIAENAFGSSQGVSFVVQNTGNNSVVNAAMVINVTMD